MSEECNGKDEVSAPEALVAGIKKGRIDALNEVLVFTQELLERRGPLVDPRMGQQILQFASDKIRAVYDL